MENLYSGRTNLSSNLKPLTVATDAKAKLEEIDDKFRKATTQINEDEQRRAKRIGNLNAVKATNYRTAMTNLALWNQAFNGLGKGLEGFIEKDLRDKKQEVLEGGHTFEEDPVSYTKLLEHGELLKALEKGQIKSQETAEKLNNLGLTEVAERYVSLSDYNRRGIDFAYMQNKAATADSGWFGWLEQNQDLELEGIGIDGKPTTFAVKNFNKLLPSQQQQITRRYGNEITRGIMPQYDAATREKYLLAPVRSWEKRFLASASSKSTVLRARDHIESKTQLLQTHVTEALDSQDWSVARSALINWRKSTKFQWNVLEQEGKLGQRKAGELMVVKQEELMEEILKNAGHKNAQEVLDNLIIPVLQTKQYEEIPVVNKNGEPVLDSDGKVVYKKGKQILPFGESLSDHGTRFKVKDWKAKTIEIINESFDDEQKAQEGTVESYVNNVILGFADGTPPSDGDKQQAVNDFIDNNEWVLARPDLMKKLREIREYKPAKLTVAGTTKRLDQLHAKHGKMWPTGELGNLDLNSEQVKNYMETHGVTTSDTEWGKGPDKDIILADQKRIKAALGYNKTLGFDRKNGEAVYTSAWLAVQIKAQILQREHETKFGVKVSDSKFINQVVAEELELIEAGANNKNSQYFKTPYGYENYDRDSFFDNRSDLISPKYANQMSTYLKAKTQHGIGGLRDTLFLENHPELLVKTQKHKQTSGKEGTSTIETSYHPVLCVMARDMGVLPSTLYESQLALRGESEQALAEKALEETLIEAKFPTEDLLELNNMQRLGIDKNFFNRKMNQNLDFPWGSSPIEDLLGDYPPGFGVDKDQAFNDSLSQGLTRHGALRSYLKATRPGIDIATENRIINHLNSQGLIKIS